MSKQSTKPASESGTAISWPIYRRLLLGYSAHYWRFFLLSFIGYLLYAGAQTSYAHLMKYFVDGIESGEEVYIYAVPAAAVGITLLRGIAYFLGTYFLTRISLNVVNDLRKELFDHLMVLPSQVHDNSNSGELVSMITYNVTQVSAAATQAVKVLFREGLLVIGLLGYLLYQNWRLTLLFILVAPILAGLVSYVGKKFRYLSEKMQASMGKVTHISNEALQGYRIVRSYGGEDYESSRFYEASDKNTKQGVRFSFVDSIQTPVLQFIIATALAGIMFLVLYMNRSEGATTGDLVAYVTAAGLIAKPVRTLSEIIAIVQKGLAAAQSVFDMLDRPPEENSGSAQLERIQGRIDIKDLTFSYESDQPVLQGINLIIEPGQTVALVGRSGSGKSTLANLLLRFYEVDNGQILLDGVDINDIEIASLRKQLALVNQQVVLFNDTVERNIAYGQLADVSKEDILKAANDAHTIEFINELPNGMDTLVGEDGTRLSGGQRQRLSIARALLKDAPILILDEATSALDTESERNIQEALEAVMAGRTTLVIAHRLSTIENADHIVVMDQGRIVEQGTHQELIDQSGYYAKLHSINFSEELV